MAEHEFESPRNRDDRSEKMPAHMLPGDSLPEHDCTEELAKTRSDAHHKLKINGHGASASERRERRRAVISAPVRVRNVDATAGPDETTTTLDVSRKGLLVNAADSSFYRGMEVAVTFPYSRIKGVPQAEQLGRVVRVCEMPGKRYSVAIALNTGAAEIVNAKGEHIERRQTTPLDTRTWEATTINPKKPMILVVDADPAIRMTCKTYLDAEGYEVIAVGTADEAHEVLGMFTPALVIAEIEGPDLPGYELCAHIKGTPRLQPIPVLLLTSSAYPSDYANAHSLGAVVCMAKPFRQERLGHVVRLLAPTPAAKSQPAAMACTPDPRRKTAGAGKKATVSAKASAGRFRLRSPW
jgi:twitching motility two-component system response regulator PilG